MYNKPLIWLAVLGICGSASGSEYQTESEPVSSWEMILAESGRKRESISLKLALKTVGEATRRLNPDLAAAQKRIDEARARVKQSGLLLNPALSTSFEQDPNFREVGGRIAFSQAFPITGRLRLEKDVTKAELAVAMAEVEDVERRIIGEARQSAVQFLALQRQMELRVQQLKVARELADYISVAAAKGEGSQLDAVQAKLEANQLEIDLRQLDAGSHQLVGTLKTLIGLKPSDSLSLYGSLKDISMPAREELDLSRRKDYGAAQASAFAASRAVKLEKAKKWQDITVGLFAGYAREEDAPRGLEDEQRVGFQLSIPLPFWNNNQGTVEERKATEGRLKASIVALDNRIRNEVRTDYLLMSTQATLAIDIESSLLPEARKQMENTTTAYHNGLVDLLKVLRARDQYLRLQSALLEARRDFHLARVRYETGLGQAK